MENLKKLTFSLQIFTLKKKILLLHASSNYLPTKQISCKMKHEVEKA